MKVSIIVPVFNLAPYLKECLDSIGAQKIADWEAICIDDGSTDGSGRILDEYAEKDSRFKVIHKENGGVASARNVGLEVASGDWIAFLDADDVWAPWTLEYAARAIDENDDADLVRFDTADFWESGEYPWKVTESISFVFDVEDVSGRIDSRSATCFFGGKIYRRDLVAGIKFENYMVGEDLLFLTQCLVRARKQIYVKACCYGYRQRMGSASHVGGIRMQRDRLGYIPKILQAYDSTDKDVDKALWRSYANKLTEQFVMSQFHLAEDVRNGLWREWRESLGNVMRLKKLSLFQKVRIRTLLLFPFLPMTWLLCYLPYWMKLKIRS